MNSASPDSCIYPYIKKRLTSLRCLAFLVRKSKDYCQSVSFYYSKNFYISWFRPSLFEQSLRAISEAASPWLTSSKSLLNQTPASGSFPMSQFFTSGGQSIGASASVLPVNIQDWFPLGWTGCISLQSKALSRVFSNTTIQNLSFLYRPTLTSTQDY